MILPAYIWKYLTFLDLLPPCLSLPATFHAGLVTELPLGTSKGLIFPDSAPLGEHMCFQMLRLAPLVRGLAQGPA